MGRVRTVDRLAASAREGQPTQLRKGAVLRPYLNRRGYPVVATKRSGIRKKQFVHVLVAHAFVPGWFEGATVDHLDGVKTNNLPTNLEWVTKAENTRRQNAAGRGVPKGELHPGARLANADVSKVFELRQAGLSFSEIGEALGVSMSLAHKIFTGKRRTAVVA